MRAATCRKSKRLEPTDSLAPKSENFDTHRQQCVTPRLHLWSSIQLQVHKPIVGIARWLWQMLLQAVQKLFQSGWEA